MILTLDAIRTGYALGATFGHGWAVALRDAGPLVRESTMREAVENDSISPLNRLHEEQEAQERGILATPSFAHITRSGSITWQVHPDGSATISSGANTYAFDGEWPRTLTGRTVVTEITAAPGVFVAVPGDGRLVAMLRMAANAVWTGECQPGICRASMMSEREDPAPIPAWI